MKQTWKYFNLKWIKDKDKGLIRVPDINQDRDGAN